ncbi:Crp/Fnr family transcriptional regulator [Variovorax sp. J22P168]|uniref:Crp/Fnr family transcriptional regulator n=1 Tax=Variovorax jilinensis TaxID=3053513 RepID=UPI0025763AF8|nr:Crp/Fnr family transcriptional regulator [Variovorax sp. J22P168]MDM0015488.1 Crp/Fnr family transcriptional regulator [Variovorax sp. J22P168]
MAGHIALAHRPDESMTGQNLLLEALSPHAHTALLSKLERVPMPLGLVLQPPQRPITHVFFPTTAVVSLLHVLENGTCSEVAVVGNEGMVGVPGFFGGGLSSGRAAVQIAGEGLRLDCLALRDEFESKGEVFYLLLRYTAALIAQICQTSVCNRHHSLDQRLARWLLLSLDRVQGNAFRMTQEQIANLLGVRRAGINESAARLQRDGVVHYARGRITVVDRLALEHRACECYAVVSAEYARRRPVSEGGLIAASPWPEADADSVARQASLFEGTR